MQHAHQENSDGFSYTKGGYCRLCSTEHLKTLQMNSDWNVYRKKSKLIYISNRQILLNNSYLLIKLQSLNDISILKQFGTNLLDAGKTKFQKELLMDVKEI